MHLYSNHITCIESNWGGMYDCRYLLSIEAYNEAKNDNPEWINLIEEVAFLNEKAFARKRASPVFTNYSDEALRGECNTIGPRLKPEVLKWLEDNIKDRIDKKCTKGWAIGTDDYNERQLIKFHIFFHRQQDALNFIKKWSTFAKPETDFNYFSDTRRQLDKTSMKMKKVESFD